MKKLLPFLSLIILASCGESENADNFATKNILENLTYTVDTVVVDPGDDLFVIPYGLGFMGFTQDKGRLWFFEEDPLNLTQVDLNELTLLSKTEFQKEGPNGVGPYISGFQIGSNMQLAIQSYVSYGLFNTLGEKTENLKIIPEDIDAELANDHQQLYQQAVYDFQNNRVYTQPYKEGDADKELFVLDPVSKKVSKFPIPKMKSVNEFSRTYVDESGENGMIYFFAPYDFAEIENGKLLISAATMSGFYQLDPEKEQVEFIDIEHKVVPNTWNVTLRNEYSDPAGFIEDSRKVNEQLNFMAIRWDDTRQMYLRLGTKTYLAENLGDSPSYAVYLFAYDKDFKVLGETKIDGLDEFNNSYFWKDGKLWSYVNVEDELGFAIFDFNLNQQ